MQVILFLAFLFVLSTALVVSGVYLLAGTGFALVVSGAFVFILAAIVRYGVSQNG